MVRRVQFDHINMIYWDYNTEHVCDDITSQKLGEPVKSSVFEVSILDHKTTAMLDSGAETSLCSADTWKQVSSVVSHPV